MACGEVRPGRFLKPCHFLARLLTSICEWLNSTCPSRSFQQGIVADSGACSWQNKTEWNTKKERYKQFKYNLTLRRVRVTIVTVEKQFWVCVCRLRCPSCTAHAPYCHVACLALQYLSTFSHIWHKVKKKCYWNLTLYRRSADRFI
jgi:hypothetical protein